jgi:hypothetical protein
MNIKTRRNPRGGGLKPNKGSFQMFAALIYSSQLLASFELSITRLSMGLTKGLQRVYKGGKPAATCVGLIGIAGSASVK